MKTKTEYIKVASYEAKKGEVKKVVLLYSGGLDTSVMIKWIKEQYNAEVIALTIDIGQIADDLQEIRKKALALGASKAIMIDAKDEFANDYISHGIKANANYQQGYRLATAIGRPLLAKLAVKVAADEGADCIAHGCTGKGNDQVRIEGTALALNPDIKIIAPVREWSMGRDEEIEYAKKHNIPVSQTKEKPYSYDDNMWGISGEGGEIENPNLIPPLEKILLINKLPENAPDEAEYVRLDFVKGLPVTLNGSDMKLSDLIMKLNGIGAEHGVGTNIHIEDRVVGLKIRDIFEAPAAEIIVTAHRALEYYVSTRAENEFKSGVDTKWAYLCYGGLWYEPLMDDINTFVDNVNKKVTGVVTLKLFKGSASVVALETPNTIFEEKLATFMASSAFNQNAAAGFIELYTLQMRLAQRSERTVLVSIGQQKNKQALLKTVKVLHEDGYKLYATEKTHEFLKQNKIPSILVHKISQPNQIPNLSKLLREKRFDFIINIPGAKADNKKEKSDGDIMREMAVGTNVNLITSVSVAENFVDKLHKEHIYRKK